MSLVMCDNDFTTLSIIMMILARYDSYPIAQQILKTTEPLLLMHKSNSKFKNMYYEVLVTSK